MAADNESPPLPQSLEDWQEAVNLSHALLHIDSARQYGLVRGGPYIDADRCAQIIREGEQRQIRPDPDATSAFIAAWNRSCDQIV